MSQNYGKQRLSPRKLFLVVNIIRVAHTGMTYSLVARNVDISEVLCRFLTKNREKWGKIATARYLSLKVVKVIYIRIADVFILSFSGRF